jgi:hypothetical protein
METKYLNYLGEILEINPKNIRDKIKYFVNLRDNNVHKPLSFKIYDEVVSKLTIIEQEYAAS